jgi:hypothetical protein
LQNKAFFYILEASDKPVGWAYEAWDDMVENLSHKDNHNRAIAAQILCNLAKSDPKNRMQKDFDKLLAVTKAKGSSPHGIACKRYGKSVLQERNNRNYWWNVVSGSASQKRTAR